MKREEGNGQPLAVNGGDLNLKDEFVTVLKTMLLLERGYGPRYIVRILRGEEQMYAKKPEHLLLETFGTCMFYSSDRLKAILYEMVAFGLLEPDQPDCAVLNITDTGKIFLDEPNDVIVPAQNLNFSAQSRFVRMKILNFRTQRAQADNVRTYTVFTEYAADHLALQMPKTLEALKEVPGFNAYKAERYGEGLLATIQEGLQLWERVKKNNRLRRYRNSKKYHAVRNQYAVDKAPEDIAHVVGLKVSTVHEYLCHLHSHGEINLKPWIENQVDKKILFRGCEYFQKTEKPTLKEAHEVLGIDYDTLKLCRAYLVPAMVTPQLKPVSA